MPNSAGIICVWTAIKGLNRSKQLMTIHFVRYLSDVICTSQNQFLLSGPISTWAIT